MTRPASALRESFAALTVLLTQMVRALVSRPETVDFPFGPPEISHGYRGRITVDPEKCRGCSLCVRDCPALALELQREGKNVFKLIYYPARCAFCGQCEASCTFGAITQTNEIVHGTSDPEALQEVLVDRRSASPEDAEG